ncbi:embryonic polarity protein dorsal-like isoform X2 [Sipha flava]|nr:embryonic polarity protein dorsal-like isoform X2 [Sipha flava]
MDPVQQMHSPSSNNGRRSTNSPYIEIIEQPASKALRFRYECEGRSAGSIPGVNSTTENKTYPTIQIVGYKGRAVVVVSCVTKDKPYRPHPHNLVGRDNCKKGICTIEINNESMTASFQNLGIQCVKRKDIDDALKVREKIRVDPFRTGFSHKDNPASIDLNAVKLCFQAFLEGSQKGEYSILKPIVSETIYDKKAMSDLVICRLSSASATVSGDNEVILLCEKVIKDDIQIRFFEEKDDGTCVWEGYADFQPSDVHKQVAIYFRTPKYRTTDIQNRVNVKIQLRRPSDGMCSDSRPFIFTPDYSVRALNQDPNNRKRPRLIYRDPPTCDPIPLAQSPSFISEMVVDQRSISVPIKEEPENSPNSYSGLYPPSNSSVHGQLSPMYNSRTPSPSEYQFPNVNSNTLNTLPKINVRPPTGISTNLGTISGCTTTVCSMLSNQNLSTQTNYDQSTAINISPSSCLTECNDPSNLMDTTITSLDRLDSSDLISSMIVDSEQLSTNLSTRLQLTEANIPGKSDEVVISENDHLSDSFDTIADNTLNEFCKIYTKRN